jgi:hypothetical protein
MGRVDGLLTLAKQRTYSLRQPKFIKDQRLLSAAEPSAFRRASVSGGLKGGR